MTAESVFSVPENLSFEQALDLAATLLDQLEQSQLSEAETQAAIAALVYSENGARGFFVVYLSDERPVADPPTPAIVAALKTAPTVVAPLLVKNLAMSTAMAIGHRRNQNEALAVGSDRVQRRTTQLFQVLHLPALHEQAQALLASLDTAEGAYASFLARWGYDAEQRQAIRQALLETGVV